VLLNIPGSWEHCQSKRNKKNKLVENVEKIKRVCGEKGYQSPETARELHFPQVPAPKTAIVAHTNKHTKAPSTKRKGRGVPGETTLSEDKDGDRRRYELVGRCKKSLKNG